MRSSTPPMAPLFLDPYSLPQMVKDFNIEIEIEEGQQLEIKVEDQMVEHTPA